MAPGWLEAMAPGWLEAMAPGWLPAQARPHHLERDHLEVLDAGELAASA